MFDWFGQMNAEAQTLLKALSVTGGIAFVMFVGSRTKSLVSTFGAAVGAVFVLWFVFNMELLKDKAGEEIQDGRRAPVTVVVDIDV